LKLAVFNSYCFMILILSCSFYLFLNSVLSSKGVGRIFFGGWGQKKHQHRKNSTNKPLPPFYQCQVRWCTGHAPRALKGTLHQEPCTESEDLFFWKNTHFRKNAFLRKFRAIFVPRFPLGLNHPVS